MLRLFLSNVFVGVFWSLGLLALSPSVACLQDERQDQWSKVAIPAVWKEPPSGLEYTRDGFAWFRCAVEVPNSWGDQELELFVEAVDDAREVFLNGVSIGQFGNFPPEFRSGLGHDAYFKIPSQLVLLDQPNVVAVRIFFRDARTNFNVAAPVLFGGDQAIRMAGDWQHRPGDELKWSRPAEGIESLPRFRELIDSVAAKAALKKLHDEIGPLSPQAALQRFKTPGDLRMELVLGDPDIGQPLSFKFDERGRLWVVQYLQYPNPAGLTPVGRDKFLRTVYDKVPPAPPHHFVGADKITLHEDRDGDGYFEFQQTFVEGLSLVSSFAIGSGGVWVLNPPYLLFYADRDGDDRPDGDPEVHLAGFGIEDSHSLANSLRWGPDGWLYAAQGSTVTGVIKRPGSEEAPIHSLGQVIWRYHPKHRRYEIFAEGGGNSFGVEIDSQGRIFSGHNGGDTRGFHFVQGGYYQKGFGKHGELSNPYAFGYFPQMKHPSAARFTHDLLVYEATALPARYHGLVFGVAPLQSQITISERQPLGSSFQTHDVGHAFTTDDTWCRPVHIQSGPDGHIYVADFYEQRIDHASHYQGRIDQSSGRIYRIMAATDGPPPPRPTINLANHSTPELLTTLQSPNRWLREMALRIIAERSDQSAVESLKALIHDQGTRFPLDCLWALHAVGGLDLATSLELLGHADPYVRLWTVRLLCDQRLVSEEIAMRLVAMSSVEPNVEVRSQLACSARRLPPEQALPVVRTLLGRSEDLTDIHQPMLLWWAIESCIGESPDAVLTLFDSESFWQQPLVQQTILERLMRRFAQAGTQRDLMACARLLRQAPDRVCIETVLRGFEAAFQGRSLAALPDELVLALTEAGGGSLTLRLRRNDRLAVLEASRIVADNSGDRQLQLQLIEVLGDMADPDTLPVIMAVAENGTDRRLRDAAILALPAFDDPMVAKSFIDRYRGLSPAEQTMAQSVLAARANWTWALLSAIEAGRIERELISNATVRRMSLHSDPEIKAKIMQHWGTLPGETTTDMQAEMIRVQQLLAVASGNPYRGKQLYATNCGKCHVLFGEGQTVGPDLTNYQRDDLQRLLVNVVNPSAEIREGYENTIIATSDGRVLSGFVIDQDNRVVVLRGSNGETNVLSRPEIDDISVVPQSLMPGGLLHPLQEQEVRDLFAYLRATQPLQ
ncbi:MAG: c-type cytochrome [Pirellulaceae bacterium]|nr:c-type cytochrome [Pirellulaceae bacterium]